MSGITDLPFRLISRAYGAAHCYFEMLHSNAVIYGNPGSTAMIKTLKKDRPISAQLLGADPSVMLDAAQKLTALVDISSLDINAACPAKKIIRKGEGAALLEDRPRLGVIVKKLSSRVRLPVTVKMRTGFRGRDINDCVRTARACQENGAAGVCIHGRTRPQGYSGDIDYESIRAVKEALRIPVMGSGNIFDPFTAKRMLDETGCDGILVARGALGNPWIFEDIKNYLKDGRAPKAPGLPLKVKVLKGHLGYIRRYNDMAKADLLGFMGRVATWYLKGFRNAARVRNRVFTARSYEELLGLIDSVLTPE